MTRVAETLRRCTFRLPALFLLGWLTLVVEPCLAERVEPLSDMAHCDHGGTAEHPAPCPGMQAQDCRVANDLNLDWPRAAGPQCGGNLLCVVARAHPGARPGAAAAGTHGAARATGPPLHILFGHLRN